MMDEQTKLVMENERLVHFFLRRWKCFDGYEDIYAAGREGLIDAARKYDASRGIKFSGFARMYIIGYALKHLNRYAAFIRSPRRHKTKIPVSSLDAPIDDDGTLLIDILKADAAAPTKNFEHEDQLDAIRRAIGRLTERQQQVCHKLLAGDRLTKNDRDVLATLRRCALTGCHSSLERLRALCCHFRPHSGEHGGGADVSVCPNKKVRV